MSYYKRHLFICCNKKQNGEICCSRFNSKALYKYAKNKSRTLGILGKGNIAISESRCLGRCEQGPVAVVYPDNIWYQLIDINDVDDIINKHLLNGIIISRLQIK